jgi:hypothetical protein
MLHNHQIVDHTKPRLQTCNHCLRPLVLIEYHENLLKGCVYCNLWGDQGAEHGRTCPATICEQSREC